MYSKWGISLLTSTKIHSGGDLHVATSLNMINDTGVATFNFVDEDIWYQDWSTNDPNISYVDIIMKLPTWGRKLLSSGLWGVRACRWLHSHDSKSRQCR